MGRGLLQGLLPSPLLFSVFIDDPPKVLRSSNKGVNIGGAKTDSLIYADDIVLISEIQASLQKRSRPAKGTVSGMDTLLSRKGVR